MSTLSRGYFSTRQTIPAFNRRGKLELSALHMHLLEQIQSYIERTSLGWGSSRSLLKFKVIAKVTQSHIKVTFKVTSKIILEVIQGHFKVKFKIARKDMKGHFKLTLVNNVLLLPKLVRRISNAS